MRFCGLLLCFLIAAAGCTDPHKHPDENAELKRERAIQAKIDESNRLEKEASNLESRASALQIGDGGDLTQTVRRETIQKLNDARSKLMEVLAREDLERTSEPKRRARLQDQVQDLESRIQAQIKVLNGTEEAKP